MKNLKKFSVIDIVLIGLLGALIMVSTMIKIPYGNGAMVHLGSAAIFTSAIIFGGLRAGIAAAIGTTLFDISSSFFIYTPWSLVIKGVAAFIVGTVAHSGNSNGKSLVKNLLGCLIAAAWTLGGYLVAWTVVIGKFEAAVLNIPSSLMSSGVGMLIALPLATTLSVALEKSGLSKKLLNK